jgi:5-methyltetrahydrofolate--homocysteine methyltransferase
MFEEFVDAISTMKEQEALAIARRLVDAGEDLMQIVERCSQAMEIVGKRFEAGEYFLPELMMAGEIVKQISEMVKPKTPGGAALTKKGTVLIGTVEGDVHDIGKDIVAFLLDVNGFKVHDVGVDVSPAAFVKAIEDYQPQVLGLSGLLTVAYDSMKNTVRAIEEAGLRERVKIMIGGGQMSENVRKYAGADAFGKDAIAGVTLAKTWTRRSL